MYKIVLWINEDMTEYREIFCNYNQEHILVIGNGVAKLSLDQLILTHEQQAKIDSSTQLVFMSHGAFNGNDLTTDYIMNHGDTEVRAEGVDVISKILSNTKSLNLDNGILCHIISCYAALTLEAMYNNPYRGVMNEIPTKSTILFHGGMNLARAQAVLCALSLVKNASLTTNVGSIEERLYMVKQMMIQSGVIGAMQHLGHMDEIDDLSIAMIGKENIHRIKLSKPNILHINYCTTESTCLDLQEFMQEFWNDVATVIDRKLGISLNRDIGVIEPFEHMIRTILHGSMMLSPNLLDGVHETQLEEAQGLILNATQQIVDSLFSLISNNIISVDQYYQLIATMFCLADSSVSETNTNFMKQYYSALLSHGYDFMSTTYDGPMIFKMSPKSFEILMHLNCDLPPLLIKNDDEESLLAHILSDMQTAAKILHKSGIYFIDISIDDTLRKSAFEAISKCNNNLYDLDIILKHLKAIDVLPEDIALLTKVSYGKAIDFILARSNTRALNLTSSICSLKDKEEYEEIASYADIKVGFMDEGKKSIDSVLAQLQASGCSKLEISKEMVLEGIINEIDLLYTIASACAQASQITCDIDTQTIKDNLSAGYDKSANPLQDLLVIVEQALDPLFAELARHRNVQEVIQQIIDYHSKPLIIIIAESYNAVEVMPIILKYSADIDLSPQLILTLAHTPHAAQLMPMILDKASGWHIEISRALSIELQAFPDLWEVMHHNKHIIVNNYDVVEVKVDVDVLGEEQFSPCYHLTQSIS